MSHRNSKALILFLFTLAIFLRLGRLIPNLEYVTTALVVTGILISRKSSFLLTLAVMAVTDTILGNSSIFLFTWSGFLIPSFVSPSLTHLSNFKSKLMGALAFGLATNFFFYFWTNFGVWLLDSWKMYPDTAAGLFQCYVNGLPFLKNQLASTFLFLPTTLTLIQFLSSLSQRKFSLSVLLAKVVKTGYNP